MSRNRRRLVLIGTFWCVAVGLLPAGQLSAQWLPELNLTNETAFDKYASYNNAWCVAADSAGRVSVVWEDDRSGWHVYCKQRTDTAWSEDSLLVETGSLNPSTTADGLGSTHVVWQDGRDPGWGEIYYKENTGVGWSDDVRLTVDTSMSEYPCIAADGLGNLHVVWQDWRNGNWEIYYKMRDSLGNWQTEERLTVGSTDCGMPSVTADPSADVHVVWTDNRDGNNEIYYRFKSGGIWSPDTALTTDDNLISSYSSIAADIRGHTHVVWHDQRNGFWEIYHKERTGSIWCPDTSIVAIGNPGWPNIASDCFDNIDVVWLDSRDGYWRVYYKMRDTSGTWSADFPVSASYYPYEGAAGNPSVAADRYGNIHVVWQVDYWDSLDITDGGDIFYREKRAPIGIEEGSAVRHESSSVGLFQNSPNPFHQSTVISYSLPATVEVTLAIYDITGRLVEMLVNQSQQPGIHQVRWDRGSNPCGVYFYSLRTGESAETRKMVVVE